MVKDLIATLARDGADSGLFITLAAPTKAMTTEAAAAGFYESPNGKKYPRLPLLTVAGLLDGTQRAQHPEYEANTAACFNPPRQRASHDRRGKTKPPLRMIAEVAVGRGSGRGNAALKAPTSA